MNASHIWVTSTMTIPHHTTPFFSLLPRTRRHSQIYFFSLSSREVYPHACTAIRQCFGRTALVCSNQTFGGLLFNIWVYILVCLFHSFCIQSFSSTQSSPRLLLQFQFWWYWFPSPSSPPGLDFSGEFATCEGRVRGGWWWLALMGRPTKVDEWGTQQEQLKLASTG